jgi:hypothetical protein
MYMWLDVYSTLTWEIIVILEQIVSQDRVENR